MIPTFIHKLRLSKKDIIIYSFIILAALVIRIIALSLSDNVWGGDPDERIRLTARWLGLGISRPLYPSGLWLPLHFYLISIAIKIFPNIPLNVRIMHVIFGVLTIIPFYELVHLVFDKKTALISSLLFAFYPLHIVCSVTTLSEGPFELKEVFFKVCGMM